MILGIDEAAVRLAAGDVVAYPTETVYGLAADPTRARAVRALERLKGRDPGRGLSVLLPDPAALRRWVAVPPKRAEMLAARFWPGPLTIVLGGCDRRLAAVATELGVGFRCSPHPTAIALARTTPCPILSTSCNRSGEPPVRSSGEVEALFGPRLAIAGGDPAGGAEPSTVVAVDAGGELRILRVGALSAERLLES